MFAKQLHICWCFPKCFAAQASKGIIVHSSYFPEAVGDLTSRLGGDCQRLSYVIGIDIHLILRNFLQGIGALINLLTLSWPLALSTLVICSVLSIIFLAYGQYQRKAAKFTQEYSACANEVARETFSLMRTVRVYGTEEQEVGRYKHWLNKLASISIRESVAFGFWNLSFNTLYRSTQVLAVFLGGMSILIGHVSAEQLMKYVLYCEWLIYAAWRVEDNLSSLLRSVGASEKVFQLMVLMPSDQFLSEGMKLQKLVGKIEFVNVSFYYPSRLMARITTQTTSTMDLKEIPFMEEDSLVKIIIEGDIVIQEGEEEEVSIALLVLVLHVKSVPVLENVNIAVRANEMVAIVGLSGSGKSTLVNLLLRLYEPTNGQSPEAPNPQHLLQKIVIWPLLAGPYCVTASELQILVDGFPLTKLDIRWLRDKIGFVGQEPHLFHMDIKSNINYCCSRDIKQEDVEWAAKQAHAHEFISSLPNGYETVVDDGLLSGGQKQRIAIARAIVRDPAILIFDEATSALDAENEYYIARVLHAFRNDTRAKRTVIIIAHRLSTVKAADRIMVMDRGRVVEIGNHAELLHRDGLYARLVRTKTDALG
ncbi:hypothetical protein U1Q18_038313 [Sarracenia purpurea var. burkii]